ncbi:MAG: PAS domain-containing protein [Deltaproteobacteria bacterium]|nr:PAS domain-containing protein [Deltaproteobacteria bacterium]
MIRDLPLVIIMVLVAILVAFISGEMKKDKEGLQSLFNEVEKSKKILELTFDSAVDLISVHDKEYRIVKVNRAICDKFKKKPQELIGIKCYELFHKTDSPIPFCPHEETMRTKEPASSEVDDPNMGGIFNVCTAPMFDEKGEFVGSVHIARDITKEREKQRQLIQSEKLATLGTMVSGFAHEVNNPLTSVVGYAELLLGNDGLNEDAKRHVKLIYNESIRAAKISSNFLSFAREHKPIKDWTNIHEILEATLSLRTYFFTQHNIEIIKEYAGFLPPICADYHQLQQVFLNIIVNAEYAMFEANGKGNILIKTEVVKNEGENFIKISFHDDGPGIPQENINRLFDPFFTTKPEGKGTGLGLSLSYGIIQEHGGKICLDKNSHKGAQFIIELPVNVVRSPL